MGLFLFPGQDQHQVAGLGAELFDDGRQLFGGIKFVDRGFDGLIQPVADINQSGSSYLRAFHKICQLVDLLARILTAAGGIDAHHQFGIVENLEILSFNEFIQFGKGHPEADIGFVGTV